jgi:hypothetical protein
MNQGNDSMNQGIASLAGLAKGYADEQKGIAVSNAVAALSNTKNDAERTSVFDSHAANLRDHGIDLKDLIAANQAQHTSLNSDATLKGNLDMNASNIARNDSTIAGNVVQQKGYGIANDSALKTLENLGVVQTDTHNAALQNLEQSAAAIRSSDASAAASGASAEHSRAMTGQIGKENSKTELQRNAAANYAKLLNDPSVMSKDPVTGTTVVDQSKVYDLAMAGGMNPLDLIVGKNAYATITERDRTDAASTEAAKQKEARSLSSFNQSLKDDGEVRKLGVDSSIAALDTDWNMFGDTDLAKGTATLRAAASKTFVDAEGNTAKVPLLVIDAAKERAAPNGDLVGDGKLAVFNNTIDAFIKKHELKPKGRKEISVPGGKVILPD